MLLDTVNPSTGEKIRSYQEMSSQEVQKILEETDAAFGLWRKTRLQERSAKMNKVADLLRRNAESYAELMAKEMGKPLAQGRAEIEKCAWAVEYYASHAAEFLKPEIIPTDASKSYVTFEPVGTVLAIMPWNFPFWQIFRYAAPTLMAGNATVVKPALNVLGCTLEIEKLFEEAGFPKSLVKTLIVDRKRVPEIIENWIVKAVTLTGSVSAGKAVAACAGQNLKKIVLELGGSDPYLVLEDADLEAAVESCVSSRLVNGGQSCIAAKRFIVIEKVRKEFERLMVEHMKNQKVGDPFEEGVTVGPLARQDLRDALHRQVTQSFARGAKLLCGGEILDKKGAFYSPTVLTDVKKGMPAYDEETFGPVAAIIPVVDEAQAIRVANDSVFGLGSAVFTKDVKRGEKIAREDLECGSAFVNTFVRSDPRLPFGGVKDSGFGRELGTYGILEFVNIKTIYIQS